VLELSEEELDALVEQATVDAYNDEEQFGGFAVMIEDNLEMPFETTVLGVMVTVKSVTQTKITRPNVDLRRGSDPPVAV